MANSGVSQSSLLNLRAELFQKQEQSRSKKEGRAGNLCPTGYQALPAAKALQKVKKEKKKGNRPPSNPGVTARNEQDEAVHGMEEKSWERAKVKLAEKAKLYDKLTSEQYSPENPEDDDYLVDFSRKFDSGQVDKDAPSSSVKRPYSSDESDSDDMGPIPLPASIEDEWTEYEDYLGRTRKCLRKDLPHMLEENKRLQQEDHQSRMSRLAGGDLFAGDRVAHSAEGFDFGNVPLAERTMLSNDMRREIERREWESQSQQDNSYNAESNASGEQEANTYTPVPEGPVHYETIKNNEIRELGVGYFKFSTNEATRLEELDRLQKLREQTLKQRSQNELLKAKRKALMDARLAKIQERKYLRPSVTDPE